MHIFPGQVPLYLPGIYQLWPCLLVRYVYCIYFALYAQHDHVVVAKQGWSNACSHDIAISPAQIPHYSINFMHTIIYMDSPLN